MTKVLIATPCYRGDINVDSSRAIASLCGLLNKKDIECSWLPISGESLVTRARNALVAYFLAGNYTHLLFVDADIVFDPTVVEKFLERNEYVMAGAYPKKNLDIQRVVHNTVDQINWKAVKEEFDKGKDVKEVSDELKKQIDTQKVFLKSLSYVVGCEEDTEVKDGWMKATEVGSGFLMIRREAFDKMIDKHPHLKYKNDCDQYNSLHENINDHFYLFFDTRVHDDRYLSEDFAFCRLVRESGMDIWVDTTAGLNHIGTCVYRGNLFLSL